MRESSLYDDYQAEDGWTDDQFQAALDNLHAASDSDEPVPQDFFIVDEAEAIPGSGAPKIQM
jgi:hypothetical protein